MKSCKVNAQRLCHSLAPASSPSLFLLCPRLQSHWLSWCTVAAHAVSFRTITLAIEFAFFCPPLCSLISHCLPPIFTSQNHTPFSRPALKTFSSQIRPLPLKCGSPLTYNLERIFPSSSILLILSRVLHSLYRFPFCLYQFPLTCLPSSCAFLPD